MAGLPVEGFPTGFAAAGFPAGLAGAGLADGFAGAGFTAGLAAAGFADGFAGAGFTAGLAGAGLAAAGFADGFCAAGLAAAPGRPDARVPWAGFCAAPGRPCAGAAGRTAVDEPPWAEDNAEARPVRAAASIDLRASAGSGNARATAARPDVTCRDTDAAVGHQKVGGDVGEYCGGDGVADRDVVGPAVAGRGDVGPAEDGTAEVRVGPDGLAVRVEVGAGRVLVRPLAVAAGRGVGEVPGRGRLLADVVGRGLVLALGVGLDPAPLGVRVEGVEGRGERVVVPPLPAGGSTRVVVGAGRFGM
ncbi:hypothetical protein [Parafrankia colletiae]|uniref:hypothetical protein n=1 Tax=Parafrankia colletiae TaxID=573497 RepID=UPI0018E369CC|nr:hypothetical protein [Parafrankia colletiae]